MAIQSIPNIAKRYCELIISTSDNGATYLKGLYGKNNVLIGKAFFVYFALKLFLAKIILMEECEDKAQSEVLCDAIEKYLSEIDIPVPNGKIVNFEYLLKAEKSIWAAYDRGGYAAVGRDVFNAVGANDYGIIPHEILTEPFPIAIKNDLKKEMYRATDVNSGMGCFSSITVFSLTIITLMLLV